MKFINKVTLSALGIAAILAGCSSSDSNSSSASSDKNGAAANNVQTFDVSSCNDEIDALSLNKLEMAKEDMNSFYSQLADGQFKRAQATSAAIKSTYAEVLKNYPAYCEAQLGYSVAIITDIFTNQVFSDLIDSLDNQKTPNLFKMSAEDASRIVVKAGSMSKEESQKIITDRVQDVIANNLLPAVDSAITYLTNVVKDGSVTVLYKNDGRTYELDNGEFAPALGALYLTRAMMVVVASRNVDASMNGSFSWIDELNSMNFDNYKNNAAAKHLTDLFRKDNGFGAVKSGWEKAYSNVPGMLDSAISYVQAGLQYGIDEAKKGLAGQLHDPYVVGDGEDADVSVKDMQAAIDAMSEVKDALHNDFTYDIDEKHSITINISKFFQMTNPKEYLPYYQIVDPKDWFKPLASDTWTDALERGSYATAQLSSALSSVFANSYEDFYVDVDEEYYDEEEGEYKDGISLYYDIEYPHGYAYGSYSVTIDGCELSLKRSSYKYYDYSGDYDYVYNSETGEYEYVHNSKNPAPDTVKAEIKSIKISSDFCKVEGGTTKFLTSESRVVPNLFNLTDKSGKVTVSFRELNRGVKYPCDDHFHYRSYNVKELKELLVFPDVTFGGVFPGMTEEKFWDLMTADWDDTGDMLDDAEDSIEDFFRHDRESDESSSPVYSDPDYDWITNWDSPSFDYDDSDDFDNYD